LEVVFTSLKDNKRRITAIISQELENKVQLLSEGERRTKSAMTAILIEEAIRYREQQKGAIKND
jgi:predicted transcriptional regulator